ncbi:MAG: hypothetical protein HS115_15005 [Spirochaetales bacterium]|nr:hypothetical protein [Spirochaetales bacterium]
MRHLFYPAAEHLLPDEPGRKLVGGFPSYFIRILPELTVLAFYYALILLLEYALTVYLIQLIDLFKLSKVFKVGFLTQENFAWLAARMRLGLTWILLLYAAFRLLLIWGTELYLTARALILLVRLPLFARSVHIPLGKIRLIAMEQWPGERLFTTGQIRIVFSDHEAIVVPMVPFVEEKVRLITAELPQ